MYILCFAGQLSSIDVKQWAAVMSLCKLIASVPVLVQVTAVHAIKCSTAAGRYIQYYSEFQHLCKVHPARHIVVPSKVQFSLLHVVQRQFT